VDDVRPLVVLIEASEAAARLPEESGG